MSSLTMTMFVTWFKLMDNRIVIYFNVVLAQYMEGR
jgi:hypothetical protein